MAPKALALIAALFAGGAAQAADALTAPDKRITDESIRSDYETIEAVQKRIRALNDAGRPLADYDLAKAQCWLDTSFHEYSRNDRSNYPQEALAESGRLVAAMESGVAPARSTPLIAGATRLREDLWARAQSLKDHRGFRCAQRQTACLEVELVHAGHEYAQYGWRHARSYIQMAEDLAGQASAVAEACEPPPAPALPPSPSPPPAAAGPAERLTLSADVLFAFDRAGLDDISAGGRDRLAQFAERLGTAYERVDTLIIYGHADRLGSANYNLKLSQSRAETIKQHLQSLGVTAPVTASGQGSVRPVSTCGPIRQRQQLIDCLAPDRRVEIEVYGVRKP
jgi:outer membrane protein OmpA-like peptidoglycan-associated protein